MSLMYPALAGSFFTTVSTLERHLGTILTFEHGFAYNRSAYPTEVDSINNSTVAGEGATNRFNFEQTAQEFSI